MSNSFFSNKDCEYYPCHETDKELNCMFCYCPLYALGEECGGNFNYLENGIKDCSNCMVPHSPDAAEYIMSKWELIAELAKKK